MYNFIKKMCLNNNRIYAGDYGDDIGRYKFFRGKIVYHCRKDHNHEKEIICGA